MGWENRTGLTVLWIATALIAPMLARGRARLRLQTVICLGLIVFGLGGAILFQSLPGFRLFRHRADVPRCGNPRRLARGNSNPGDVRATSI